MRIIDTIIVHCSATKPSMDIGVEAIRQWHMNKGWSDIGYHYVIRRNGVVELGRDLDKDGDVDTGNTAFTRHHITFVYDGSFWIERSRTGWF